MGWIDPEARRVFDHSLDLTIGPGMVRLGQPMVPILARDLGRPADPVALQAPKERRASQVGGSSPAVHTGNRQVVSN